MVVQPSARSSFRKLLSPGKVACAVCFGPYSASRPQATADLFSLSVVLLFPEISY